MADSLGVMIAQEFANRGVAIGPACEMARATVPELRRLLADESAHLWVITAEAPDGLIEFTFAPNADQALDAIDAAGLGQCKIFAVHSLLRDALGRILAAQAPAGTPTH
jgi:hypothetical protein